MVMSAENLPGKKLKYEARMLNYSVTLSDSHVKMAKNIGEGNLSEGIRKSIEEYAKQRLAGVSNP